MPGKRRGPGVEVLQVEALCWCGARATHNARTVGGRMVVEGAQVVIGDVGAGDEIGYEVLCRRHHRRRMTAAAARAGALSPDVLPPDAPSPDVLCPDVLCPDVLPVDSDASDVSGQSVPV